MKDRPLCVAASCIAYGQHQRDPECVDDECRGCLPRPAADGSYLCPRCTRRIGDNATAAAFLHAELARVLTSSGGGGEKTSGTKNPGLALNDQAMTARAEIRACLASWCQFIVEERGWTPPRDQVPALAAYIGRNAPWLAANSAVAPEVGDALWALSHGPARAIAYPSGTRRVHITACLIPDCPGRIMAILRDDPLLPSVLTCTADADHTWPADQWRQIGKSLHPGSTVRYLTAVDVATEQRLPMGTVYALASGDRWRRTADGIRPALYLASDVDATMRKRAGTMKEPIEVFAVTNDECDDCGDDRVLALFERQDDANAAVSTGLGQAVTPLMYYPAGAELPRRVDFWEAGAALRPDGTVRHRYEQTGSVWTSAIGTIPTRRPQVSQTPLHGDQETQIGAVCIDKEAAIKAVDDRIAKVRDDLANLAPLEQNPPDQSELSSTEVNDAR